MKYISDELKNLKKTGLYRELSVVDNSQGAYLEIEMTAETGRGYSPAEERGRLPIGELPVDAIRTAQRHRDQIVSRLRQLIERAVQHVEDGGKIETNGHFFAFFLLIEFRAAEAFDTIIRAVSLPDDLPYELFGDGIYETLPLVVPTMRCTSGARSAATACCKGTISTSVPPGTSSAAMI